MCIVGNGHMLSCVTRDSNGITCVAPAKRGNRITTTTIGGGSCLASGATFTSVFN